MRNHAAVTHCHHINHNSYISNNNKQQPQHNPKLFRSVISNHSNERLRWVKLLQCFLQLTDWIVWHPPHQDPPQDPETEGCIQFSKPFLNLISASRVHGEKKFATRTARSLFSDSLFLSLRLSISLFPPSSFARSLPASGRRTEWEFVVVPSSVVLVVWSKARTASCGGGNQYEEQSRGTALFTHDFRLQTSDCSSLCVCVYVNVHAMCVPSRRYGYFQSDLSIELENRAKMMIFAWWKPDGSSPHTIATQGF